MDYFNNIIVTKSQDLTYVNLMSEWNAILSAGDFGM